MNWELYEVWGICNDDTEALIETTKSLKEAKEIARIHIADDTSDIVECVIYYEDNDGKLVEIDTVQTG